MEAPETSIKNRSPRLARKDVGQFPATVINLTRTTTAQLPEYRSMSSHPMKEALVMGLAFFFVYTSFQAIQNLQSSLHEAGGLGVASLGCVYGAVFFTSFVTPALIYYTGVKAAIMAAWAGHCLYVVCNFIPHWVTLIPGSLVMGALSCPLWTSLEIYMTSLARKEVADSKKQTTFHASFSRLNGAFFSVFMGSQLSGNLISSTVLFQSSHSDVAEKAPEAKRCGVHFCSEPGQTKKELEVPDSGTIQALLSVFLLCELCGLALTAVCLPDLQQPRWTGPDVWRKVTSHLESLTNPRLWLLVPFLISRMMNLAIEVGTFTQAYISCSLGVHMVGYVMASWGLATMVSAALLGWLARYIGRRVLCMSALASDALIFLVLTWWEPDSEQEAVFFGLAVLMGLAEGVWAVQVNALIATMFPMTADSAFAVKGMWSSLSMALTFFTATFLCPLIRLYLAIVMILIALVAYLVLEFKHLQ